MDTNPNYPSPSRDQLWRERDAESHMVFIGKRMKLANDIVNAFLAFKDQMAALSEQFGADTNEVSAVFERLAEWHLGILKRAG